MKWERLDGPFGGIITAIVEDEKGQMFVGTNAGDLYRSSDGGNNWSRILTGIVNSTILSIVIDKDGKIFVGYSGGVLRSTDSGQTWTFVIQDQQVFALTRSSSDYIYVSVDLGMFRSTNHGDSWTYSRFIVRNPALTADTNGFLVTGGGFTFRSHESDVVWSMNSNYDLDAYEIFVLHTDRKNLLYAGTDSGLWASTDMGARWYKLWKNEKDPKIKSVAVTASDHIFVVSGIGYIYDIAPDKSFTTIIPLNQRSIRFSTIYCSKQNDLYSGSNGSGVLKSTDDGISWVAANNHLSSGVVNDLTINSAGIMYLATSGGIFRSSDDGISWIKKNSGLNNLCIQSITSLNNDDVLAGSDSGEIYLSQNNADSWQKVMDRTDWKPIDDFYQSMLGEVYAVGWSGVYKSTTNGRDWIRTSSFSAITILSGNDSSMYMGGWGVYTSSDFGTSWTPIFTGLPREQISSLAVNRKNYLYTGLMMRNGLYVSRDKGTTWEYAGGNLNEIACSVIAINAIDFIFAFDALTSKMFRSSDDGQHWEDVSQGLPKGWILNISFSKNGICYVGSHGAGLYRSTVSTTDIRSFDNPNFSSFHLSPNFPNPFSHSTSISYSLRQHSHVRLEAFNALGVKIATLVDEEQTAGTHNSNFNPGESSALQSGVVFFYRLTLDGKAQTRKMLVMP